MLISYIQSIMMIILEVICCKIFFESFAEKRSKNNYRNYSIILGAKKLKIGGWLNSIIPMLIVPYYCVVGGWVCKYLFEYLRGSSQILTQDTYFSNFIANPISPAFWLVVFAVLTFIVVIKGVEKGIEKVSKILMPILVVIAIFISIYRIMAIGYGNLMVGFEAVKGMTFLNMG